MSRKQKDEQAKASRDKQSAAKSDAWGMSAQDALRINYLDQANS